MTDTQTDDDFESGFNEAVGESAPSKDEPQGQEAAQGSADDTPNGAGENPSGDSDQGQPAGDTADADDGGQAAGEEQSTDLWAEAPEPLKAEHEALKKRYADIDHRYRSESGRMGTVQRNFSHLQSENQALKRQLAAYQTDAAATDEKGNANQGAADDDKLASLREDYPEIAGPIEEILNASTQKTAALEQRLQAMDEEKFNNHILSEQDALSEKHDDWIDVAASDEFKNWIGTQPQLVQDALQRNSEAIVDHQEAAVVIELFKRSDAYRQEAAGEPEPDPEPKKPTSRRDLQRRSAAAPSSRNTGAGGDGPADDFEASFEYHAAK